jgi:hypothetical protein
MVEERSSGSQPLERVALAVKYGEVLKGLAGPVCVGLDINYIGTATRDHPPPLQAIDGGKQLG